MRGSSPKAKKSIAASAPPDRALAKRKLGDLQRDLARIDLAAGKSRLAEMCDRRLQASEVAGQVDA